MQARSAQCEAQSKTVLFCGELKRVTETGLRVPDVDVTLQYLHSRHILDPPIIAERVGFRSEGGAPRLALSLWRCRISHKKGNCVCPTRIAL